MVSVADTSGRPRRGRPPRTPAQQASHRDDLVRGAMAAIREHGHGLTLDALAAGAGVSKPVLYDEFGSRVGVADAIADALSLDLERRAVERLAGAGRVNVTVLIEALTDAFVTMVDDEADLYEFVVRTLWNDGRGLLGNPLVRILHERVQPLIGSRSAIDPDRLTILIDGMYGFMLASVQSWKADPRLSREEMVAMLGTILRESLRVAHAPPETPRSGA